jgi:hypothetical protein
LRLVEAVGVIAPITSATHAGPGGRLVIVEVGGAPRLFGGHAPQAHALVGEENSGAGQQELPELQDRIETPALEEEDAAAEQADSREKHVVIAGQGWLEAPHEIEEGPANGQHDANDAGPIQAGVDHGSMFPFKSL